MVSPLQSQTDSPRQWCKGHQEAQSMHKAGLKCGQNLFGEIKPFIRRRDTGRRGMSPGFPPAESDRLCKGRQTNPLEVRQEGRQRSQKRVLPARRRTPCRGNTGEECICALEQEKQGFAEGSPFISLSKSPLLLMGMKVPTPLILRTSVTD